MPHLGAKSLNANCCYTKNKDALNNLQLQYFSNLGQKKVLLRQLQKLFNVPPSFQLNFLEQGGLSQAF